jgi:hypothetical protein
LAATSSADATAGYDSGTIELWDVTATPREVFTLRGKEVFSAATFSRYGRTLAASSLETALVQWESFPWQVGAYLGEENRTWRDPRVNREFPRSVTAYAKEYWRERMRAEEHGREHAAAHAVSVDLPLDPSLLPSRDPRTTRRQLDLTEFYTGQLSEPFSPQFNIQRQDHDLASLRSGYVGYGGVSFDVRGVIQLRRAEASGGLWEQIWAQYPVQVEGIPVGQSCRQLALLLGTAHSAAPDTAIGQLVLHYADGAKAVLDLVYGRDVREWCWDPQTREDQSTDRSRMVWIGSNPIAEATGRQLRLYLTSRDHPRPETPITTLDFVSTLSPSAPFLIAITLQ